jgi:hypothetical protein
MDERLPFLPEDFDDRYFQSAPPDQQFAEFPAEAAFACYNMSPGGRFVARLPVLDVPVRFMFDERFETSRLLPDTVILEPERQRMMVVGRTSVPLPRKFTRLREVQVGRPRRALTASKPYYKSLSEAIRALRRGRSGNLSEPLYVTCLGLICAVGLTPESAGAAMRAGIAGFEELPYFDDDGEPVIGAMVPSLPKELRGRARRIHDLRHTFAGSSPAAGSSICSRSGSEYVPAPG